MSKRFRVMRGATSGPGKGLAMGITWEAENARAAVQKDREHDEKDYRRQADMGLFTPVRSAPIVSVYELTKVPESDWK